MENIEMVFFGFKGIRLINIKIFWINKDVIIIIMKRYFYQVVAFITIRSMIILVRKFLDWFDNLLEIH